MTDGERVLLADPMRGISLLKKGCVVQRQIFGHLKDEINLLACYSLDDVRGYLEEYLYNYNHHRYQWHRKKMTPVEYRNHLLAS